MSPERTPLSPIPPTQVRTLRVDVLDTFMFQRETGSGSALVLLHGNPTSSHVFRNVMAELASRAHCIAPDLVGMGQSGKPGGPYRFADHARYLDAWFDTLDLRDVVLCGYDWGGVLALNWAARHPERVRGVALLETFLRTMHWSDWPREGVELFQALRTPGVGEQMVLERNEFLARSLGHGVRSGLSDADRVVYEAPYPDAASRLPLLAWPREIPIEGEPADVAEVVLRNARWLGQRSDLPKLLLVAEGNMLSSPELVDWARSAFAPLDVTSLGPAGHHATEDAPAAVAGALADWMSRHGL